MLWYIMKLLQMDILVQVQQASEYKISIQTSLILNAKTL